MVNLSKGQSIKLEKQGQALGKASMGLGWDAAKKKGFFGMFGGGGGEIDLDASCLVFEGNNLTDVVWFRQLQSRDGLIQHSGDNRTGVGDGDDEVIKVNLASLKPSVTNLVFTVNSFRGQTFNEVENAFCRLLDEGGQEMARFNLGEKGSHTGLIMAKLSRSGSSWSLQALGVPSRGATFQEMLPDILRLL